MFYPQRSTWRPTWWPTWRWTWYGGRQGGAQDDERGDQGCQGHRQGEELRAELVEWLWRWRICRCTRWRARPRRSKSMGQTCIGQTCLMARKWQSSLPVKREEKKSKLLVILSPLEALDQSGRSRTTLNNETIDFQWTGIKMQGAHPAEVSSL